MDPLKAAQNAAKQVIGQVKAATTPRTTSPEGKTTPGVLGKLPHVSADQLMAEFMGHIVDIEGITSGVGQTGGAPGLGIGGTDRPHGGQPAAAGGEDMADVIVGRADHGIEIGLILPQYRGGIVVGVGIAGGIGIDIPTRFSTVAWTSRT